MFHPLAELVYVNDTIGYGVFAKKTIPKGTITWVQDRFDQVIPQSDDQFFEPLERALLEKFAYINEENQYVLCWDLGKYINHNCRYNTLSTGFTFDIAIEDIPQGAELVTDYAQLNLETSFSCQCQSVVCRQTITSKNAGALIEVWDQKITNVFPLILSTPQALWPWVKEKSQVIKAVHNQKHIPSTAHHMLKSNL